MADVNLNTALQASLTGMTRASEQTAKAAEDILEATGAFVASVDKATAASAGDRVDLSAQGQAVADVATENARAAAVVADVSSGDLAKPLVDLLAAKQAFAASATTLRVTADVEEKLIGAVKA